MMDIQSKSFQNEYETTFILKPELSEAECKEAVDKVVAMIKDAGGAIHNIERWGMRKLAYPINKKTNGYYALVEFRADTEFIESLERNFRYDDNVIRFLTVKLEKHALEFNTKRRAQNFGLRKDAKVS